MFKSIFVCVFVFLCVSGDTDPRPKIIIDNDAGGDDAMAVFIALLYEQHLSGPKIVALTTGAGNTDEDNVCRNNQWLLKLAGREDIPIYRGARKSLVNTFVKSKYYYGVDGMGDSGEKIVDLVAPQNKSAVTALIEYSKLYEGELIIVTIGTLTNVATAMIVDPDFLGRLKQLHIGAGHIHSEIHSGAEFNARTDAEAYHVVVQNANPDKVTIFPFSQVKDYLKYTKEWRTDVLGGMKTNIMHYQNKFEKVSMSKENVWEKLDPAVVALTLRPDLVEEYRYAKNDIILCGEERGMNTNQFVAKEDANVRVAYALRHEEYQQFLLDVLKHDANSAVNNRTV
ncbi:uncharacterized protein LOC142979788 [Anticarsia gemmatalis]|uniref:uncharacterized protein LOC142979788 n=1 Tax=Anticarsia gemmatalis TaxID=129554 RepID=UPI003F75CF5C